MWKFDGKRYESKLKVENEENAGEKPSWIVNETDVFQDKSNVSLFKFCIDNLSIKNSVVLKLPNIAITVMGLICVFRYTITSLFFCNANI